MMAFHHTPIILIVILLCCAQLLFADIGWDVSVGSGAYASFPSEIQEDELPMRTHGSFSTYISPITVTLPYDSALSFQVALQYTTKSISYGAVYWKQFTTFSLGGELSFLQHSPISFSIAAMYSIQFPNDDRGAIDYLSTRGTLIIPVSTKNERFNILLLAPIEIDFRSDYLGVRYGIGLRFDYRRDDI